MTPTKDCYDNWFIVVWDNLGLESIIPVTEIEKTSMFKILKNEDPGPSANTILNAMMLRARFNSHRHYEIYAVSATEDISKEMLETLFRESPQIGADLIRERGTKIYSDRINTDNYKII